MRDSIIFAYSPDSPFEILIHERGCLLLVGDVLFEHALAIAIIGGLITDL